MGIQTLNIKGKHHDLYSTSRTVANSKTMSELVRISFFSVLRLSLHAKCSPTSQIVKYPSSMRGWHWLQLTMLGTRPLDFKESKICKAQVQRRASWQALIPMLKLAYGNARHLKYTELHELHGLSHQKHPKTLKSRRMVHISQDRELANL